MTENNNSCGPGGIVWSHADVATVDEIVAHFEAMDNWRSINWGTALDNSVWSVTDETYINGVMMELDFDYRMGYLLQAVDKTSGWCTYIAVVFYHGRRRDGTFEKDYMAYSKGHQFFGADELFQARVMHWAVDAILRAIDSHDDAQRRSRDRD